MGSNDNVRECWNCNASSLLCKKCIEQDKKEKETKELKWNGINTNMEVEYAKEYKAEWIGEE